MCIPDSDSTLVLLCSSPMCSHHSLSRNSLLSESKALCMVSKHTSTLLNTQLPLIASYIYHRAFHSLFLSCLKTTLLTAKPTMSTWNMSGRFVRNNAIPGNILAPPQSRPYLWEKLYREAMCLSSLNPLPPPRTIHFLSPHRRPLLFP